MKPNRKQSELSQEEILTLEFIDCMETVDSYGSDNLQVYLQF